ncbi:MAG: GYDIA family GHMP kinase [Bacteroidota bacterium]
MKSFHAHGKLLISSEYMVMHGATALAVPLNLGQTLDLIPRERSGSFLWNATTPEGLWFSARISPASLSILDTTDPEMAGRLVRLLRACISLQPEFQEEMFRYDVITSLDFSPDYGFGSSSTLIALMADWAGINPLDLHFEVSDGSGYDVACALAEGPILYTLRNGSPRYQPALFNPAFRDQIYFAWLGHKQSTAPHLKEIAGTIRPDYETIRTFSQFSQDMLHADTLDTFREIMEKHEATLSGILGMEKVASRFEGLPGSVKSLGAWGGDFVMIATDANLKTIMEYLKQKGIKKVYPYNELVHEGS